MPTTFVPHIRMTLSGTLPGAEIFSCNLSIGDFDGAGLDAFISPNDAIWQDMVDDAVAFWGSADAHISNAAVLKRVTFAYIGADGHYTKAPIEFAVNTPGEWVAGDAAQVRPNQFATKVTLHTLGDLGRVKGGFYLPMTGYPLQGDGLMTDADAEKIETAASAFIEAVGNQPGLDALDLRVVVASQGRYNYDNDGNRIGTRVGPANHLVTGVSVGRRPDVIRRRANRLQELRDVTPVSQA